ncbi:MAG: TRAM domain-containing protein, partial [Planctomycetes bacterium]|nr:TRAM domain-containing protein [Planctomycetota bacterium]
VLDSAILSDSRLPALLKTGLFANRLLVHRSVIARLETTARSADPVEAARATRALEGLKDIRALGNPRVEIDETEIPNSPDLGDLLVRLARLESATLLAGDRDLVRVAEAEGVPIVDLAALASVLAPAAKPGEVISITIEKPGEGKGQGIGFLDDGSMVVVNGAADHIGKSVRATVMRTHATSNGRMVFAERVI